MCSFRAIIGVCSVGPWQVCDAGSWDCAYYRCLTPGGHYTCVAQVVASSLQAHRTETMVDGLPCAASDRIKVRVDDQNLVDFFDFHILQFDFRFGRSFGRHQLLHNSEHPGLNFEWCILTFGWWLCQVFRANWCINVPFSGNCRWCVSWASSSVWRMFL